MTCRYALKRLASLVAAVQAPPAARVIEWPQKVHHPVAPRERTAPAMKHTKEENHARK